MKKELCQLHKNMNFDGRGESNEKSVLKIKSETNIPMTQSKAYSQKMGESKKYEDVKIM